MTRDEKKIQILQLLNNVDFDKPRNKGIDERELIELAFTVSELNLCPDEVDSLSKEQILFCWGLVEFLFRYSLPEELRM